MRNWKFAGLATAALLAATPAWAQIKVGVIMSQSGPASSIGVPYVKGIAAFMVFPDRTLIEMARTKPVDLYALRTVHGVGERKREAYGERFVAAIAEFLADAPALR